MIDLSPCDSPADDLPRTADARRERVLHVHLGTPEEPQTGLTGALRDLAHGNYVQVNWYGVHAHELPLPEQILHGADGIRPTLIWMQLQGKVLEPSFLRILRKRYPNALLVSWCGDVGRDPAWSHELAPEVDAMLFSSMTQVEEHRAAGFPNAAYLQIGYDTDIHRLHTSEAVLDRRHRLVFLGQNYTDAHWKLDHEAALRREAVYALAELDDIDFEVFGQGWPEPVPTLNRKDSAELYRNSTCALSISLTSKLKRYSSDRLLRALACGPAVFVKRFAEMESWGLQHRENCLVWDTIDELRALARWAFHQRGMLRDIGRAGAELARSAHTWHRRMREQAVYLEYIRAQKGL